MVLSLAAQDITRTQADSLAGVLSRRVPDTARLNILLNLAGFSIHQRHLSDTGAATVNAYLNEAAQLNKKLNFPPFVEERILLIRSGLYKAQGNSKEGKALLSQVITALQAKNNKTLLGKAYYEMSDYFSGDFLHATMMERIRFLKLAISAFQATNDLVGMARCYRFLADLHQMTNNNTDAFSEVRAALKFYEQAHYPEIQGALSLLGRLYYEQGDYKQALHYELEALKVATNSSDDNVRLICQINNNIGYTYFKLNDNKNALQFWLQSLKIAEQDRDNATIYLLAANVVDAYLQLNVPMDAAKFFQNITKKFAIPAERKYEGGDYGISQTYLKIYLALKQYDKAKIYCDELIRQTQNPHINLYALSLYYELIARYYIQTANYDYARNYLKKDSELVSSLKSLSGLYQNYKLGFSLDTASSRYPQAISNLVKANEVKDSIIDETKSKQIARLEVEFETEKKEAQITLLNQEAILEATKLRESNFEKDVTIAGVILLFLIAGLLYRQSNFRKKSNIIVTYKNKQLESLLNEKEWLLKEVHHRVKNNLHTVISLLKLQTPYLEKDAQRAIESSQNRIYAMSLIHQKLYQSDNMGTIDLDIYLRELMNYLSDSFGSPANVHIRLHLEKIKLSLAQAIPLGIIVNEAVTNAFKYAFPNKRPGEITMELKQTGDNIELIIADNGVGMPDLENGDLPKSLGLHLIRGLTTELDGTVRFENGNGTKMSIVI